MPGTKTDCDLPLCCTNLTDVADDPDKAAGYWGSYSCDTPVWTFEDMLSQIKEKYSNVSLVHPCDAICNISLFTKTENNTNNSSLNIFTGYRLHNVHWRLSTSQCMAAIEGEEYPIRKSHN